MDRMLYQLLASLVQARINCAKSGNVEWFDRHTERARELVKRHMPSGSGFDSGTTLDLDRSAPERLVFKADYHHMNDGGFYDGWTRHEVIVTPSLASGFSLRITGRDRNEFKDYAHEVFYSSLREVISAKEEA